MRSLASFPWPVLPSGEAPIWMGRGFTLDGRHANVLPYSDDPSGWTEELTAFHDAEAGANHPIDVASRELAVAGLRRLTSPNPVVLEVGCSSGLLLHHVRRTLPNISLVGTDFIRRPLERLAVEIPEVPLLQFNLLTCPLPDASVDGVVLLNVLEHIPDDVAALRQVYRILRPGGIAVIEVPSGPGLYDVYDRMLMHYRRYSRRTLHRRVRAAGFDVTWASHLGALVFPPFALVKLRNRRYLSQCRAVQQRIVAGNIASTRSSGLLRLAFGLERILGRWICWPNGIRCVMIAQKRTTA